MTAILFALFLTPDYAVGITATEAPTADVASYDLVPVQPVRVAAVTKAAATVTTVALAGDCANGSCSAGPVRRAAGAVVSRVRSGGPVRRLFRRLRNR